MADMNNAPLGRHFKQPAGQGAPGAQMPQQPPMNGHGGRAQQGGVPYGSPAPKKRSKTPFIVAGIIIVLLGVLGGVGAAALFSAKDLKAQSSEVLTCVDGLSESVKAQDFGAAAEDAQQITNLSGDMVDKLSSPLWTAVFFVPVVGRLDGFMKGLPCVEPPSISWTREMGGFLMSGDLRLRYDESMRRMAAELFADGCGYHSAATRLGLPPATVRKWHRAHVALGLEGLLAMGKKIRSYRWELKASAARDVVEGGEPKAAVMARYGIASLSPLEKWCKAYREGGAEALRPKPKGRPPGSGAKSVRKTRE